MTATQISDTDIVTGDVYVAAYVELATGYQPRMVVTSPPWSARRRVVMHFDNSDTVVEAFRSAANPAETVSISIPAYVERVRSLYRDIHALTNRQNVG